MLFSARNLRVNMRQKNKCQKNVHVEATLFADELKFVILAKPNQQIKRANNHNEDSS